MLEAMKALAERSVMERIVLLVNHVIGAEPAAVERLRPHASRTMQIELTGWPALLPRVGPFAFRVTPAGLVEWLAESAAPAADLRIAVDASNPALALTRVVAGERPQVVVSGDAAFASDIDWLIDNLRWDLQDDLARVVGDVPARQIAKVGGWLAGAVREGAKMLRDLAAP
jgi:ubiquinone biosynthesis protein UbiJ